jgi:hypothetical protein
LFQLSGHCYEEIRQAFKLTKKIWLSGRMSITQIKRCGFQAISIQATGTSVAVGWQHEYIPPLPFLRLLCSWYNAEPDLLDGQVAH